MFRRKGEKKFTMSDCVDIETVFDIKACMKVDASTQTFSIPLISIDASVETMAIESSVEKKEMQTMTDPVVHELPMIKEEVAMADESTVTDDMMTPMTPMSSMATMTETLVIEETPRTSVESKRSSSSDSKRSRKQKCEACNPNESHEAKRKSTVK
jgi:hypothetical protein